MRSVVRIILPLSVIAGILLLLFGVIANFNGAQDVSMLANGHQTILRGPVAAWEPIKLMSGDGGGAFNVNRTPRRGSNVVEIIAMILVPIAFIRTFGVMIGDKKQG